jgi:uncharacterized DUF497 family protein
VVGGQVLRWIWDPEKARINRRDHKVSFDLAELVFDDPLAVTLPDPYPHEEGWRTIGAPGAQSDVVLFVVHTWPAEDAGGEEVGRIISARKATRGERRAYEEGTF